MRPLAGLPAAVLLASCAGIAPGGTVGAPTTSTIPVTVTVTADDEILEPAPDTRVAGDDGPNDTAEPPTSGPDGPGSALAFAELRADSDGRLVRWRRDVLTVAATGAPTPTDLDTLRAFAAGISGRTGVPRLDLVAGASADIVVHFLHRDAWREAIPDALADDDVDGQARYVQVDGTITEVAIVVDVASSQTQRNRTIVHEMLHAFGLGHHTCPGGILFGGSGYDPDWRLREYDLALLDAWHAPHRGEPVIGVDLPCPPVRWDTVTFEGMLLWCRTDASECYRVDDRDGVDVDAGPAGWRAGATISRHDPARFEAFTSDGLTVLCTRGEGVRPCQTAAEREIIAPDRWYDGKYLYDHDPGRYIVLLLDGRRLLCRIPDDGRAPCQYTQGIELTATDLYTDGETVYDTP